MVLPKHISDATLKPSPEHNWCAQNRSASYGPTNLRGMVDTLGYLFYLGLTTMLISRLI